MSYLFDTLSGVLFQRLRCRLVTVVVVCFLTVSYRVVDATKAVAEIPAPAQVAEVVFFLLPTSPLPAGSGAVLYYAAPPFTNWELLGSIDHSCPSAILRTGWSSDEALQNAPGVRGALYSHILSLLQAVTICT